MQSQESQYKFELDVWRGQFVHRETESSFQLELMQSQWRAFAGVAALIFIIDAMSLFIDAWRQNSERGDVFLVSTRLIAMVAGAIFVWVSWRHHQNRRYVWAVEVYVMLIVAIMSTTLFFHGDYGFIAPVTLICVIYALYLLTPFLWRRQITYALMFTALGCWALLVKGDGTTDFARLTQWLIFAHLAGILVSWQRHIGQRRLYGKRISLEWLNALETQERAHHQALVDLITHELRNPLASIHSQAELVQRVGDPMSRRHAKEILDASMRIRQMLYVWVEGDRLANSGRSEVQAQGNELDADEFFQLTLQVIERARELYPRLRVERDDRFGFRAVHVDGRTYALVLLNLLENAAKYGVREGCDHVRVVVRVRHARGRVWVRVRDWGQGIAYNQQHAVFEKYQRPHTQGSWGNSGTGVGLHLCKALLSLHNASLWLKSEPRLGTAFVIDLKSK